MHALAFFLAFLAYASFVSTFLYGYKYFKEKFKKHHKLGSLVAFTFVINTVSFLLYLYVNYFWQK